MKNTNNFVLKLFLFPLLIALITSSLITFVEAKSDSGLISNTQFEYTLAFAMLFLTLYLFITLIAVPLDYFLARYVRNPFKQALLFNFIGVAIITCFYFWISENDNLKSLFLIFPLYSLLCFILTKRHALPKNKYDA